WFQEPRETEIMKPRTLAKVGRPLIGDRPMTSGERSKRYRTESKGKVYSRSFDLSSEAMNDLQRAADLSGVSARGALLVAIHLLAAQEPAEVRRLAERVSLLYGARIEVQDGRGRKSRVGSVTAGRRQ